MDNHETSALASVDDQARDEALEVLRDAHDWTATTEWWSEFDEVLTRLQATWDAGDGKAFRRATSDLEALSAERANDAGKDSKTPPPPPTRDILNDTIHNIGSK